MTVSAIAAAGLNHVIGDGDDIPWRVPDDMKYFKRTTLNHHVIMGRKTFDTMGRPLPKRTNIILTRDMMFTGTGLLVAHSVEEALTMAYDNDEEEVFIIGGGEIYRQSMKFWDKVYLTRIMAEPAGEVRFPELPREEWQLISSDPHQADERNEHAYTFEVYTKKI